MALQIGIGKIALALAISVLLAACAFNTAPKYDVNPASGSQEMVKRYPKYPDWEELFFWRTKEYHKVDGKLSWLLSEDQRNTIAAYGQPEYVRRVFFSTRGDRVNEWLFWNKQRVVQFVQGKLVWDGNLTDLEKVLLLHGRPKVFNLTTTEELHARKVWMEYERFLGHRQWVFFFVNDRMVIGKENL